MVDFNFFSKRSDLPEFFFSEREKKQICAAIQDLEKQTSAELHVHVERRDRKTELLTQARQAFERLGMTKTQARNGVLIFICSDSREFAVLGDTGLHQNLPESFWADTVNVMSQHLKENRFSAGILAGISKAGEPLKKYFPGQKRDRNELSDDVSYR